MSPRVPRVERIVELVRADAPDAAALLERYLAELDARLGGFDPARSVPADADDMAPPRGAFVLIRAGGAAVACGGVKPVSLRTGEIKRMFVAPEARGQGHGRA
ncbi:MAG TPA: GNAT family N-acetyltransferase, partial [Minicystis sp.]|nr:GNAT family N-acetyltransferase [Minicystis sp.]